MACECNDVYSVANRNKWQKKLLAREKVTGQMYLTNSFVSKSDLRDELRTYEIHDNGGRPFKVIANENGIYIYTHDNKYFEDYDYNIFVKEYNQFVGYWSGFDSTSYEMHGNSILIKMDKYNYVYVGAEIFSFLADEEITDYISPVGNNDVPYPIAYTTNYVYFPFDKSYLYRNQLETPVSVKNAEKLSQEFYGHLDNKPAQWQPMKDVQMIHERNI